MQRILMKSVLIKIGREFLFSLAVKIKMSHFLKTQFRRFFIFLSLHSNQKMKNAELFNYHVKCFASLTI